VNAKVFVKALHAASGEFSAISREVANLMQELETVERELRGQSEFQQHLQVLRKVEEAMHEERYKLRVLSEAVNNAGSLYQHTETSIEDGFDGVSTGPILPAEKVPLTEVDQKLNRILYGG